MKPLYLHGKIAAVLALLVCVPALAASDSAKEVEAEYRQFIKMAGEVSRKEPELINQPNFDQKFTLRYQRYSGSQEAVPFKMIFSVAPESVKLEQIARAYVKYGKEASALSEQLLPFVREHVSMFTDTNYAASYSGRYNQVLQTLFPDESGKLKKFSVFDCDYTTQPTDAFWYQVHAMRILDHFGTALYGRAWEKKRDELMLKNKIHTVEEMRLAVEPGLNGKLGGAEGQDPDESTEIQPAK
ncbi:MAG: hypothetical protein ACXWQO_09610 [Bdellovibrionota bacterium]